jgi:hypothetical protein
MDERDAFNWKIVDVPITIERQGSELIVKRTSSGEFPAGVERIAFLEIRPFVRFINDNHISAESAIEDYDHELAAGFYRVLPGLIKQPDYRAMNGFAAVRAVFRWARHAGATFAGKLPESAAVRTPDAITLIDGKLKPATLKTEGDQVRILLGARWRNERVGMRRSLPLHAALR